MPFNALAAHRPSAKAWYGRNSIPYIPMASGIQTCYQRVCGSTTGHWGSGNPTLTISLRCCRATTYPSSVVPALQPCSCPLALSGLGEAFTSKSSALNFGHLWWQFLPCVTRRTLSPHTARERQGLRHVFRSLTPWSPPWSASAYVNYLGTRAFLLPLGPSPCT